MAITDLLSRIPFPPALRRGGAVADAASASDTWIDYSAPAAFTPRPSPRPTSHPPTALPSWAILAMAALAFSCLALTAALVTQTAAAGGATEALQTLTDADMVPVGATASGSVSGGGREGLPLGPSQTTVTADPTPVPADVLARLEAAGDEPLHGELTQLLAAIQTGFGRGSAQLDPALRAYATRMASRFEWNPDTFRVSVTASSAELAGARAETLRRLFGAAVSSGRLVIEPGTGPDALTLASL